METAPVLQRLQKCLDLLLLLLLLQLVTLVLDLHY
jgi:hypothetical protein